ncbi:hypothetical protein [Exiguobacterium sp. s22]|uniref:hypothetical protein n=1 Tax=Exiguobacterium sp. s22 TaxID=2751272 RepID=UPI0033386889
MKRNRSVWMILLFILVGAGIVYFAMTLFGDGEDPVKPPLPTVRVGSVTTEVEQSTYCWESGNQATCADYGLPEADDLQLITVKPGDRIDVVYHADPMESSFNRIEDGEIVSADAIVPDEPGVYLYEIGGEWKQGDSRYVFGVRVPEK